MLGFVEHPSPLGWIKTIAKPGLYLVVHSVTMVLGCIASRRDRFRRQIDQPGHHLATEPGCFFKVKAFPGLELYRTSRVAMLVHIIVALIWLHE